MEFQADKNFEYGETDLRNFWMLYVYIMSIHKNAVFITE